MLSQDWEEIKKMYKIKIEINEIKKRQNTVRIFHPVLDFFLYMSS